MTSRLHDYRCRAWAVPFRRLTSQFGVVIGSGWAALPTLSARWVTEREFQGASGIYHLAGRRSDLVTSVASLRCAQPAPWGQGILEHHRQQTRIQLVDAVEFAPGPLSRAVGGQIRVDGRWVARLAQAHGVLQSWKGAR